MYHDEIPERCKLNFTGIVDDALRIAGELFPKQTLKKYIRKEVEIDTDGRVRSRRFEKKKKKVAERLRDQIGTKSARSWITEPQILDNEYWPKLDKIQFRNEDTNAAVGNDAGVTVSDSQTAEALAQCYAKESKVAFSR
ncbi:hypothetical protein TNCV_2186011 [Trichonephila clavipes]|nr:hypothetical protein TNCV_2186011 [Trichonephila clavipes]